MFWPLNADGDESEGAGVDWGWLHQGYHVAEHRAERKVSHTEDDDLQIILTYERELAFGNEIPLTTTGTDTGFRYIFIVFEINNVFHKVLQCVSNIGHSGVIAGQNIFSFTFI